MKGIFVSTGLQLAARGLAALAHCVNGRSLPISGTRSFPVCFMQASSVHCFAGFSPGAFFCNPQAAIRKLRSDGCWQGARRGWTFLVAASCLCSHSPDGRDDRCVMAAWGARSRPSGELEQRHSNVQPRSSGRQSLTLTITLTRPSSPSR